MQLLSKASLFSLPLILLTAATVDAQLVWRVSVKVICDENNNRFDDTCLGGTNDGLSCDPDLECPDGACIDRIC